jgi:hypothetical protein
MPSAKARRVRSAKDLKPSNSTLFSLYNSHPSPAVCQDLLGAKH